MKWFDNIKAKIHQSILNKTDDYKMKFYAESKGDSAKSTALNYESETLQSQSLNEWKTAVLLATHTESPDKSALNTLYKNLKLDNHLMSVIDSRILFCQRSPFKIVNEKGDENKDISWLFERTWFEDFIRLVLLSRFEGTKLLELYDIDPLTQELKHVEEIPMQFFNAKKGIITKNSGGSTGWLYKEGTLVNYYIQVGKNKDLGILSDMTPIILAKKLGFGSWLDYIEKYGVGNLFITTDREDDERLKELADAAKNFKASGFMVGRGSEKFEIKGSDSGDSQNFDLLINRANDEMSKRILGGSGLTNNKSFVGSSEIQFRLAKDRFEADKLLVKNVVNQQLIPRLQKLSKVYSVLSGHYFEWDNSELQTHEELKNMITALAPYFELDSQEISQKTGFKIISQKSNGNL